MRVVFIVVIQVMVVHTVLTVESMSVGRKMSNLGIASYQRRNIEPRA